jgi:hypothetical protein
MGIGNRINELIKQWQIIRKLGPKFAYDLPLFNQFIDTVTYAHLSDEYDTLEYAKDAFKEPLRSAMLASIKRHFERTSTPNQQND